jgi:hypothetical protein
MSVDNVREYGFTRMDPKLILTPLFHKVFERKKKEKRRKLKKQKTTEKTKEAENRK